MLTKNYSYSIALKATIKFDLFITKTTYYNLLSREYTKLEITNENCVIAKLRKPLQLITGTFLNT